MTALRNSEPLLRAENLTMRFGGITAVKQVGFAVGPGEIVGLIGPNGAGKTTCFNMLTGFYTPTEGRVFFRGTDITSHKPHAIARLGLIRSFQKTNVMKRLTVFENVLTGHYMEGRQSLLATFFPGETVRRAEREARESAAAIVETMGLSRRMNAPAHLLSCGELRLLEVAVALAAKPTLLMLDEPAAGLNSHEAMQFGETLKTLVGKAVQSLLIVEHNMELVMGVCERIVVLNFGQMLAEGEPRAILDNPMVAEAYLGKAAA
ncbi:ABC transporter ATP-binding protein [Azospirillum sp.]|uniref:ABC transporter ATP-binding protein n=1 Tax=Azospirillum sp. TaxID=34012 RepID=UPI002D27B62C|nr:ABC transporter ATP-binding protein [Azospirillum sp.]HYF88480.1 ABC transporter ATP-binding protein [Azospirillum sp.]